jgi:HEPN domain-containing protein
MATKIVPTDMPFAVFSMEADRDYLLARMINFIGASFHARAGFFAQQACEKYMKALTVQARSEYSETHNLIELAKLCESIDTYFSENSTISNAMVVQQNLILSRKEKRWAAPPLTLRLAYKSRGHGSGKGPISTI